jgi:exodeoxyribonuclease VIII
MDNAEYHAHPAVSKSHLDMVARSPLHYWARYVDPKRVETKPTAAMALGSALHTHVLELDKWDEQYLIAPKDAPKKPTSLQRNAAKPSASTLESIQFWDAFDKEASNKTILDAEDADLVMRMGEAVYGHPAAAALLALPGMAETTWMWRDDSSGLQCKCRPDWLTNDGSLVIDLKTTEDASPKGFQASVANFRYHVQAAWYLHGMEQATKKCPEQFVFIAVEKKPPFAVAVYAADAEMIREGWRTAERDLEVLATCKEMDRWPGYSDAVEPISLPPWMRPRPDGVMPAGAPPEIEMY